MAPPPSCSFTFTLCSWHEIHPVANIAGHERETSHSHVLRPCNTATSLAARIATGEAATPKLAMVQQNLEVHHFLIQMGIFGGTISTIPWFLDIFWIFSLYLRSWSNMNIVSRGWNRVGYILVNVLDEYVAVHVWLSMMKEKLIQYDSKIHGIEGEIHWFYTLI